jgi:hypothetical protein
VDGELQEQDRRPQKRRSWSAPSEKKAIMGESDRVKDEQVGIQKDLTGITRKRTKEK